VTLHVTSRTEKLQIEERWYQDFEKGFELMNG